MSIHEDLELLDQTETELGDIADAVEESTGIDRRDFMFYSLVTAAATTFGFGSRVLAQTPAPAAGQAPQTPPPPPLGNGEPVSWTFQAVPGRHRRADGEVDARARRRRVRAIDVHRREVERRDADVDRRDRVSPRASALGAHQGAKNHVDAPHQDLSRSAQAARSDLLCAVTIMEDQALAEAARADAEIAAGKYRGPLHGLPYGVKDLFSTKGVRTTWGSSDFENRIIDEDAEMVVRLRDAGAVLIAKLATGLFANNDVSGFAAARTIRGTLAADRADRRPGPRRRRPPAASRSPSAPRRRARSCRRRASAA